MMNVPTCVWNPMGRESIQQQVHRWSHAPNLACQAASPSHSQGRDVADMVDSLRMNLRQAKHALTVRDEETRRLRSAVAHLESTLSLRERELRDTVLCLRGESPARPHQEWLQAGTSNSRLRLQVHRLQRALVAKQDHIEHLNRQASLGFLREAREQAHEYHIEVKRLTRALATATSGLGDSGRRLAGSAAARHRLSATGNAGDAFLGVDDREGGYRDHGVPASSATGYSDFFNQRMTSPSSQFVASQAKVCGGTQYVQEPERFASESKPWSLAPREYERKSKPPGPSLAWEATVGSMIQASSGGRSAVPRREATQEANIIPPSTDVSDALGAGLMVHLPPAGAAAAVCGGTRSGRRLDSPQRGSGNGSAGIGYRRRSPRGICSPDRSRAFGENKHFSLMAASARLRSQVRHSAAERREALALDEESRRLQTARAERARRARLAQQKIARYREERIRELESRLARRCGTLPPDVDPTTETVSPEEQSNTQGTEKSVSVDIATNTDNKLQRLSRQRREIEAAIAAAVEEKTNSRESPESDRLSADGVESSTLDKPPTSPRRNPMESREQEWRGEKQRLPQCKIQDDDGFRTEKDSSKHGRSSGDQEHGSRSRPEGKPPLAPSRSGGRRRQQSDVRRHSIVGEVEETLLCRGESGSIAESCARDGGADETGDVDEVQTEATGNDSVWGSSHLSDVEASVWEENIASRGWDGDEVGVVLEEIPPFTPMETEEARAWGHSNRENPRRRQRHWVRSGAHGDDEIGLESDRRREEWAPMPAYPTVAVDGGEDLRSNVVAETSSEFGPSAVDRVAVGTHFRNRRQDQTHSPRVEPCGCRGDADEERGMNPVQVQPVYRESPAEAKAIGFRTRHPDESGRARVDDDRWGETKDTARHRGGSLGRQTAPRTDGGGVADLLGAGEVREERHALDNDGSCSSRWSLSTEDEPQQKSGAEDGTRTPLANDGGGSEGQDSFGGQTGSPQSSKVHGDGRETNVCVVSKVEEGMVNGGANVAGMAPECLGDSFEDPGTHGQGDDVSFCASSPSDEEKEGFVAEEELSADRKPLSAQSSGAGRQQHQDESHVDGETARTEWVISEPPSTVQSTRTRFGENEDGLGRTRRAQRDDTDKMLLQPVSPPNLRFSVQGAEVGAPATEGFSLDRAVESQRSSVGDPSSTGHGGPDKDELARSNRAEQTATTVDNGARTSHHMGVESEPESDDVVAPIKIDSSVLFASLSSSTVGASLSSKSMARAEDKYGTTTGAGARAAAAAIQEHMSSPTFALSADDEGDAGSARGDDGDDLGIRSSASLGSKPTLESGHSRVAERNEAIVGGGSVVGDTDKLGQGSKLRPPVRPPTSANFGNDGTALSPDVDRGLTLPSSLGGRQSSPPPSDETPRGLTNSKNASIPAASQLIATMPSECEAAGSSIGDQSAPSPGEGEVGPSSEGSHQLLEAGTENALLSESQPRRKQATVDSSDVSAALEGEPEAHAAALDGNIVPSPEGPRKSTVGRLKNGPSVDEREGDISGHLDGETSLKGCEEGLCGSGHARDDVDSGQEEGLFGAPEEGSLLGGNSSHSGSALDVGGDGVGDDDDDGYF